MMTNDSYYMDRCLCCNKSRTLLPYLDLGKQPLANGYHKEGDRQDRYPLGVQVCTACFHNQLTYGVNPRLMFDDYIYVSGTSSTLRDYFRQFVTNTLNGWKGKQSKPRILEIACNDGTLLEMFRERGCKVMGVDPAKNLVELCRQSNLDVKCEYWNKTSAEALVNKEGRFDIVIAINVLPHVPNPVEFMEACRMAVAPGGKIIIQTSQCDMFNNGEFDAIYHEHHSYFTVCSFGTLAYASGLEITAASKVPIHSMSFLMELRPMTGDGHCNQYYDLFEEENTNGWHEVERYQEWASEAESKRKAFKALMEENRKAGRKLVGYGASAKANTVFNFFGVSLDYIVDDNDLKWNLYTPGRDMRIWSPSMLATEAQPLAIVLTAWNFKDEIVKKIKEIERGKHEDYIVTYIPNVKMERLADV